MNKSHLARLHCTLAFVVVGLGLLLRPGYAEDIYKSTDAQGNPVYSDRPLSSTAERLTIRSKPRDETAAQARAAQEVAELARRDEERNRETASAKAEKEASEQAQRAQQERCLAARNRYLMFEEGNRLYRRDDAGNRIYYTAAEIDAQRKASKQQMDAACSDASRPR